MTHDPTPDTEPAATQPAAWEPDPPQTNGDDGLTGQTSDPANQPDDTANPNREAAKRRRQLRDVEAERDAAMTSISERDAAIDALRAEIDRRDRQDVERIASDRLADPTDLWRANVQLSDLRAADGSIDGEQLNAVVADLLAERPHYRKPASLPDLHPGARRDAPADAPSPFADAVRNARRGS